ncbi:MAG TPA: hypothetical protein VKZ63_17965 [Kofleriaceae bacterium]|nr:hypothetical protein [Kofleriaceae bacterium]
MLQGEFQVGRALGRGFGIWLKNLPAFLLLCVLVYSPILVYTFLTLSGLGSDLGPEDVKAIERWGIVVGLGGIVFDFIATAAILYGVIQQLNGRHAGIGESVSVGLARLFPVLGVGILVGICTLLGLLALIIGAIVVGCMLYVAVPAAVMERPGVFGALQRSADLTKGYKLQIFGILLILGLIERFFTFALDQAILGDAVPSMGDVKAYFWVLMLVIITLASLNATVNAVVYHDLRVSKEGVQTEELARVFE